MFEGLMALALVVLVLFIIILILPLVAISTASRLKERVDSLELRVDDLARNQRSVAATPARAAAAAPMQPPAPAQPAAVEPMSIQPSPARPQPVPPPLVPPTPAPQVSTPPQASAPSPVEVPVPEYADLEQAVVGPPRHMEAPVAAAASAAEPEHVHTQPRGDKTDLEQLIAGNWLNRIGIIVLMLATAFFLKYAFDNNWIGPVARVGIGIAAGVALLGYSQILFRKGYLYFSEGIVALGAGVLYLSLFAGWNFYHFIPLVPAFIAMFAVTGTILGLSLARDSQRLALLALVSGFLTPLLLNTGQDAEVGLFSYLAILNAGLLVVSQLRNWRSLPLAFLFTLVYAVAWYTHYYDPSKLSTSIVFATIFFLEFATLPVLNVIRHGKLAEDQIALATLNTAWYTLALDSMLHAENRTALTIALIALAAGHLIVARLVRKTGPAAPVGQVVYDALSYTLIAVAIAVRLQGNWITVGWAVEGALLAAGGLRSRTGLLRAQGLVLLAVAAVRLAQSALGSHELERFILNPRFSTFALVVACLAYAAYEARRQRDVVSAGEYIFFAMAGIAANALTLWGLSLELWYDAPFLTPDIQRLFVVLLWTIYAVGLVLLGARRASPLLRWQGAVLLAVAILSEFSDPALAHTGSIPAVWAVLSAILVLAGLSWNSGMSRAVGLVMFGAVCMHLVLFPIVGTHFVTNGRFLTFALVIACLGTVAYIALRRSEISQGERVFYVVAEVAANALALWALSIEFWFDAPWLSQAEQRLVVMLVWTAYAVALMLIGARSRSAPPVWQSLGLLAVTVVTEFGNPALTQTGFIPIAWALSATAFVWSGLQWNTRVPRVSGLLLFAIIPIHLLVYQIDGGRFLFNPRFTTLAVVIACYGVAAYLAMQRRAELSRGEAGWFKALEVGINLLTLWALSMEFWDLTPLAPQTQQLSLTILWTLYAAGLMFLGIRRASPLLRWQGLSLLGLVLVKTFVFDLSHLNLGLRILSFLALGVVLMAVSFFYQRRVKSIQTEKDQ